MKRRGVPDINFLWVNISKSVGLVDQSYINQMTSLFVVIICYLYGDGSISLLLFIDIWVLGWVFEFFGLIIHNLYKPLYKIRTNICIKPVKNLKNYLNSFSNSPNLQQLQKYFLTKFVTILTFEFVCVLNLRSRGRGLNNGFEYFCK